MSRPAKVLLASGAVLALAAVLAACGTERITVAKSNPLYTGAVLFSQRCSGCHTLNPAATRGSAPYVRTAQANNGPNFNVRCERPVTRVLYAIENGGFSGAIMPQNVVVGEQAREVAQFVATYSGRDATQVTGGQPCQDQPIGVLPSNKQTAAQAAAAGTATTPAGPQPIPSSKAKTGGGGVGSGASGRIVTKSGGKPAGGAKPKGGGSKTTPAHP